MATMERKFQMVRLGAGDWLLPSNDGKTLFRLTKYWEDGSLYTVDERGKERKIRGEFWAVWQRPLDEAVDDPRIEDLVGWREVRSGLRTRKEAMERALEAPGVVAANQPPPPEAVRLADDARAAGNVIVDFGYRDWGAGVWRVVIEVPGVATTEGDRPPAGEMYGASWRWQGDGWRWAGGNDGWKENMTLWELRTFVCDPPPPDPKPIRKARRKA
jgi:hypothetical protein